MPALSVLCQKMRQHQVAKVLRQAHQQPGTSGTPGMSGMALPRYPGISSTSGVRLSQQPDTSGMPGKPLQNTRVYRLCRVSFFKIPGYVGSVWHHPFEIPACVRYCTLQNRLPDAPYLTAFGMSSLFHQQIMNFYRMIRRRTTNIAFLARMGLGVEAPRSPGNTPQACLIFGLLIPEPQVHSNSFSEAQK